VDKECKKDWNSGKLLVYFDEPFWVLVFERETKAGLASCKVTYGAEPKDYDIMNFIQTNYYDLKFSPAVKMDKKKDIAKNPKRVQRQIQKQMESPMLGTKSMQALKLLQEETKFARKEKKKQKKEELQQFLFEKKQQKRKEKHKGR